MKIIIIALLVAVLVLAGCTNVTVPKCGDNLCQTTEKTAGSPTYCPADCDVNPAEIPLPPTDETPDNDTPPTLPF